MENNIIILEADIFLTCREHKDKINKICFTSIGAIFNFIQIMQDDACLCTLNKQVCYCAATVPADCPVRSGGPSAVQARDEL